MSKVKMKAIHSSARRLHSTARTLARRLAHSASLGT
jgi:hypothetical protein